MKIVMKNKVDIPCPYCQKNLGWLTDSMHPVSVGCATCRTLYSCAGGKIQKTEFTIWTDDDRGCYYVVIHHDDNKVIVAKEEDISREDTLKIITELDHVPTDLNPDTAIQFLSRMLDLKAFS